MEMKWLINQRQGSSRPFIGPEPALGISAKIAREVIKGMDE
jgi:hypothetical protein